MVQAMEKASGKKVGQMGVQPHLILGNRRPDGHTSTALSTQAALALGAASEALLCTCSSWDQRYG